MGLLPLSSQMPGPFCGVSPSGEILQINSYRFRLALWTFSSSWFNIAITLWGTDNPDLKKLSCTRRLGPASQQILARLAPVVW
jgi:hypothetical protein